MPERRVVDVHFNKEATFPIVEMSVPRGTTLAELSKIQDLLDRDVLQRLSPRGCAPCMSGLHLLIREQLELVVQVDLDSGQIIGR